MVVDNNGYYNGLRRFTKLSEGGQPAASSLVLVSRLGRAPVLHSEMKCGGKAHAAGCTPEEEEGAMLSAGPLSLGLIRLIIRAIANVSHHQPFVDITKLLPTSSNHY